MASLMDQVDATLNQIIGEGGNPIAIVIPKDMISGEPSLTYREGSADLGNHRGVKVWDGPWCEIRYVNKKDQVSAKFM